MSSVGNVEKASLWRASSCESAPSPHDLTVKALHGKAGAESTLQLNSVSYFEWSDICLNAHCADWTHQNGRGQTQMGGAEPTKISEVLQTNHSWRHSAVNQHQPRKGRRTGEGWGRQEGRAHHLLLQVEGGCQPLSWNHIMWRLHSTALMTHRRLTQANTVK